MSPARPGLTQTPKGCFYPPKSLWPSWRDKVRENVLSLGWCLTGTVVCFVFKPCVPFFSPPLPLKNDLRRGWSLSRCQVTLFQTSVFPTRPPFFSPRSPRSTACQSRATSWTGSKVTSSSTTSPSTTPPDRRSRYGEYTEFDMFPNVVDKTCKRCCGHTHKPLNKCYNNNLSFNIILPSKLDEGKWVSLIFEKSEVVDNFLFTFFCLASFLFGFQNKACNNRQF